MRNQLQILCGLLFSVTLSAAIFDNNSFCPSSSNCPFGLLSPEPPGNQICWYLVNTLSASRSACEQFYGDSLVFTDQGYLNVGYGTTSNNVCDYFTPDDVVEDCLYPNGTLEINFCSPLFSLAYQLRTNCSYMYSIDTCNIPYPGQLSLNKGFGGCAPGPYIADCQKKPNPQPPERCPNCIVGSCPAS